MNTDSHVQRDSGHSTAKMTDTRVKRRRWSTLLILILAATTLRLLPHPVNATPIAATALLAGAHFPRKVYAWLVPLAAMLLSDTVYQLIFGWGFHKHMPAVYVGVMCTVGIGRLLRHSKTRVFPILSASLASSLTFFVVTNTSVWALDAFYPPTLAGLWICHIAALPFLQNAILADLGYTIVLFTLFALADYHLTQKWQGVSGPIPPDTATGTLRS